MTFSWDHTFNNEYCLRGLTDKRDWDMTLGPHQCAIKQKQNNNSHQHNTNNILLTFFNNTQQQYNAMSQNVDIVCEQYIAINIVN